MSSPADAPSTASSPLAPEADWHRLSPRYVVVRRISTVLANAVGWGLALTAVWLWAPTWARLVAVGVALAFSAWRIGRVGRWVRSWGWAEREGDLCVRYGLWTRRLTVVPMARMQLVNVKAGPLSRWQGLATIELVTAAAHTNAEIPGLEHGDATALRDRLIDRADAEDSGL